MGKREGATREQGTVAVHSKQNHAEGCRRTGIGEIAFENSTLSDSGLQTEKRKKWQCFRVRAGVFASAHGRPNGVPGRIIGARAKTLLWRSRRLEMNSFQQRQGIRPRSGARGKESVWQLDMKQGSG